MYQTLPIIQLVLPESFVKITDPGSLYLGFCGSNKLQVMLAIGLRPHFEWQALGGLRLLLGVHLSPLLFCVHGAPEPGSSVQGGRSFVLATSQDSDQDHSPVCSPQRSHMANLATLQPCPCCQPPLPSISRLILHLGIGSCCDALGLEPSL